MSEDMRAIDQSVKSLKDYDLEVVLTTLRRALDTAVEAESVAEARQWLADDVRTVCMEMTRRGIESDTVTALEL